MIASTKKLLVWVLLAIGLGILAVTGYKRFEAPHSAMEAQGIYMKSEQVAASKAEYAASSSQGRCTCGCNMSHERCGGSSHMCGTMDKSRK